MKVPTSRFFYPYVPRERKGRSRGFTLLEILIAIFIFAVVATTIFGSYNFVFSTTGALESGIAVSESARNCLSRMAADLKAVYVSFPPAYTLPGPDTVPDAYLFSGEMDSVGNTAFPRLRFTSLAHIAFEKNSREGIAEIVYYVQSGADGTFILRRSDSLYPYKPFQEKGTDPVLCENLKSVKFTFYDADGADTDHWNSDSADFRYATPRAVGIQLELESGSFSQQFSTLVALPVYRLKSQ